MPFLVNIDFAKMESALKIFVRRKAEAAGSHLIYVEDGCLIKENPKLQTKDILKVVTQH